MARGQSVFAISRGIWDDPDFADEPFTEREAWIWLVGNAAWADHRTRGAHGRAINLKRGEFSFSVRFLAEKFQWSKSRTQRFLKSVQQRDTIRDTSRDGCQIYFITKYNQFQIVGLPERDIERDSAEPEIGTEVGQQRDKVETGKTGIILSSLCSESVARGTRWSSDQSVEPEWIEAAAKSRADHKLPPVDLNLEAEKFSNYWTSAGGANAVKRNWRLAWINWALKATPSRGPPRPAFNDPESFKIINALEGMEP